MHSEATPAKARSETGEAGRLADLLRERMRAHERDRAALRGLAEATGEELTILHATHSLIAAEATGGRGSVRGRVVSAMRRLQSRLLRPLLEHQSEFNGAVTRTLSLLAEEAEKQRVTIEALRDGVADLEETVAERLPRSARPHDWASPGDRDPFAERRPEHDERIRWFVGYEPVLHVGAAGGGFLVAARDAGVEAVAAASDVGAVSSARAAGLRAVTSAPGSFLKQAADSTFGGIHVDLCGASISPAEVERVVELGAKKLRPGGRVMVACRRSEGEGDEDLYERTFRPYVELPHQAIRWLLSLYGYTPIETTLEADAVLVTSARSA